jgi:lysophospholipase L1-like esterase
MKKILIIIFLGCLYLTGNSQSQIRKNQVKGLQTTLDSLTSQITNTVTTPMIDGLSNVKVAYGVIRLKTGATKALRLRRSSDNTQQDFYFNTSGNLDAQVIISWLNGATGYVATWYDQSGNGNDATQSTVANQPYLVFEDVPKVRFQFTGANVGQALNFTLTSGITANSASVFAAYKNYVGSAASSFNSGSGGYVAQKSILGGASVNFELYEGATSPDYDAIRIASGGTAQSSVNLYGYSSPNYISVQSGGSGGKITSNYKTATFTNLGTGTETTLTIGNSNALLTPFAGDFYNFILFNTSVADATITGLAGLSKTAFNLVDNTVAALNIGAEGDSQTSAITATNNQNYPAQMQSTKRNYVFDVGISGNFIADITTKAVHVDRNIVAGKTNILFVWIGTNDISGGTTGATEYASLKTYCDARTAAGWNYVYVLTMIQRTAPGAVETQRLAYNTAIRGNGNVDWAGVVDVGADTRFQYIAGASSIYTYDAMYYTDGIHPTNAGYGIVASYIDAVIETLTNSAVTNTLTNRLSIIENNFNLLPNLYTQNSNTFNFATPNIALKGIAYTPTIVGGTLPNTTVTIQGSSAAGSGNQGQTIIEPSLGKVSFGGTGFTGPFTQKTSGTDYINWLTGATSQVIMSFNGASGALGTENLSSYLSGYTISFDGTSTFRIYSPNTLNIAGGTVNWQNASAANVGGYSGGFFGFGVAPVSTSPFTFSGSYNGIGTTTPVLFSSTVGYGPTNPSVGSTLVYNGYNLLNTFSATSIGTSTPAVVTGYTFGTTIAQPVAYTYTSITGTNALTTFNHTIGAATMTTYTGNWLQTKSTSGQNVSATTFYGTRVTPFNKTSTGTLSGTTGYALYMDDWSGSGLFTNQWGFYNANTSPSFFAGVVQLSTLTASKVVFTDASKNLTSTGIGTSSQYILGDGTLGTIGAKPHTIFTPPTGGTVSLTNNQYNIINPAGALVTLTVNLPSSPANNDCVFIKFTQNVTTVTYGNGTVADGITAPTAGGLVVLTYDSGTTSWY